jgi:hypothetical protein
MEGTSQPSGQLLHLPAASHSHPNAHKRNKCTRPRDWRPLVENRARAYDPLVMVTSTSRLCDVTPVALCAIRFSFTLLCYQLPLTRLPLGFISSVLCWLFSIVVMLVTLRTIISLVESELMYSNIVHSETRVILLDDLLE